MDTHDFLIVGIGASAGGIQAIKRFFEHVPGDSGIAYVVVLHLSPEHESHLAEVVQLSAAIPVTQVQGRVRVEPNHVYVIPPHQSLAIRDGHLALSEMTRFEERRAPVDIFFRTLADSHRSYAVCVVMSGTGANGSMGVKRVKEQGGVCFVQEPEEAEYDDMPRNSIATALVDHILPVAQMPAKIIAYKESLRVIRLPDEPVVGGPLSDERALHDIFLQLRSRTGHDFSNYKHGTVLRRIARRMAIHELPDIASYARLVREHPNEPQALLKDLLISVTNFFRDREAFDALQRRVIPKLFENRSADDQVRVWIAGCATGEEAYSIAILLAEYAAAHPDAPAVQLFATDIDEAAIATARDGAYTWNDAADVSPERLRRFFTKESTVYRVCKELREIILFAHHNIIKDPPFSHVDLVSCRNLLIYLNRTAQQRVLNVIHFALNPGGYLFLGASESIEGFGDLFATVDEDAYLFQSRAVAARLALPIPDLSVPTRAELRIQENRHAEQLRERLSAADLHQRLLEQYAPPSIVINEKQDIVHLSERAGRYLHYTGGDPSHNVLKAIRPELRVELRAALDQAVQQRTTVEAPRLALRIDGQTVVLNLVVRPVLREDDAARGFFLVLFEEMPGGTVTQEFEAAMPLRNDDTARQLEQEVLRAKAQLRATIERHETQAEELRSSNEEMQAVNEELRSSTEELESSKEELQSLNEELRTVNQELKIKVEEQAQAKDDIQNLINSTDIGTIFLDRASCIKLFTPRARDIFALIPADCGRPLSDISSSLIDTDLHDDIERVLDRFERVEREVKTRDGRWYLMRVVPYRTAADRIDGVILTFVDITGRKSVDEALRASEQRLRRALAIETVGVVFFKTDGTIIDASDAFLHLSGYTREDLEQGRVRRDKMTAPDSIAQSLVGANQLERTGRTAPYEKEYIRKDGTRWWAMFTAMRLDANEAVEFLIDINARKQAEEQLRRSEGRLRLIVESITGYAIFTMNAQGRIDSWNPGAAGMFGYVEEEVVGQPVDMLFTPEDRDHGVPEGEMRHADKGGRASDERWLIRKDGSRFFADRVTAPLRDGAGSVIGFVTIARDLTERKRWEDALREAHAQLETRVLQRTAELATANDALDAELTERRHAEERIRALMRRLITVQEDERRRIARDLHDHLGQQVAGLSLKIDALNEVSRENPVLHSAVDDAQQTISKLDRDLDFFTWEMRPAALDDLGLAVTLDNFIREWSKEFGIQADFHSRGLDHVRFAYEVETNLYRITQEALNNIYKHARASRAGVILERRGGQAVLIIEDDGIGFDRTEKPTAAHDKGVGLLGMQERAAFLGGTVEIETAPGKGTTVFVQVPLLPAENVPSDEHVEEE